VGKLKTGRPPTVLSEINLGVKFAARDDPVFTEDTMESPCDRTIQAVLPAPRNTPPNLEEIIRSLVKIHKSLPNGEQRDQLLDEISCLDVIAEVMRKALDSVKNSELSCPDLE
jgi:hypothetical protein